MALRIEEYTPSRREATRQFIETLGPRRSDEFMRWRFEGCDGVTSLIGMDGDSVGALVTSVRKPYRIFGESRACLEIFDWAALPEYRRRGLGVLLLRRLMDDGRPILVVGGSADTQALLPKMRWRHITDAAVFALPLRGQFLREKLAARGHRFAGVAGTVFDWGGKLWFGRRGGRDKDWKAVVYTGFDPRLDALYDQNQSHQLVARPSAEILSWMTTGFSRAGSYLYFKFLERDSLVGWGFARLMLLPGGLRGEIVDVFAGETNADIYKRAIASMSSALIGFGVDAIVATATCASVQSGLKRCRFILGARHPVHLYWPGNAAPPGDPCHIMGTTADNPMFPLPDLSV